jgi:hypothetical protein
VRRQAIWVLVAALGGAAGATELATGQSVRLSRTSLPRYTHVYSVYASDDNGVMVQAFGEARVGEVFDLVDERGWLGRLLVDHVESRGCGTARYLALRSRFVGHVPSREVVGRALALGPAHRAAAHARILPTTEVGDAPAGREGLLAIDVDGDGRADLAYYTLQSCGSHAAADDNAACFETWTRTPGSGEGWRRVERAEFPSCN